MADELKKVLIVDDEEDMLWSLQRNLNYEDLQVDVLVASSGEQALELLAQNHVDLLVTDIKMPGMNGIELLNSVKDNYPHCAVIVMTAFPSPEFKSEALLQGSIYFMEKPFDMKELRNVVRHSLQDDSLFKGTVAGVTLSDIIQINCLSHNTTALRVRHEGKTGIIYFDDGQIVHAICDETVGVEAFYKMLCFAGGTIESLKVAEPPEKTINTSFEALLLEGARRMDEAGGMATRNDDQIDFDIDFDLSAHDNADQPASQDTEPALEIMHQEGTNTTEIEEGEMSNVRDILSEFTNIPGVDTACLVGRDGFLLDSIAIAGIDTELIGAIASGGFGSSESMGKQLGKGQLTMTMIEYENGPVMFSPIGDEAFLVIVAEKESNLGMIRLKIKKHAKEIVSSASI